MLTPDQINTFYALGRDAYSMASELAEVHGREVACAWDVMDPDVLRETAEQPRPVVTAIHAASVDFRK